MASDLATALTAAGHLADPVPTRLAPDTRWIHGALVGADALVVVGGDGAMRLVAETAAGTGTPVYHYPTGTENLFARTFGMDATADRLIAALDAAGTTAVDVGVVDGAAFLIMASIGFDADVVHDLAARRGTSISHLSYAAPIVRRFLAWRPPRLTIDVDGERVVDGQPGCVVVANARAYALHIDPARDASMTDGRLDAVFLPARSRWGLPGLALACRLGRLDRRRGAVSRAGAVVEVRCDPPSRFQIDGDPAPDPDPVARLSASLLPDNLRVLLP